MSHELNLSVYFCTNAHIIAITVWLSSLHAIPLAPYQTRAPLVGCNKKKSTEIPRPKNNRHTNARNNREEAAKKMGISEFEVIKAAKFNSFDIVIAFNVPSLSCTAAQKLHFWQKLLWKNILSYCRCMSKDISHKMNASLWSAVAKHFFTYSRLLNFGRFHLVIFTYPFFFIYFLPWFCVHVFSLGTCNYCVRNTLNIHISFCYCHMYLVRALTRAHSFICAYFSI